jgi:glyoxylase-like metal-dependent hydrolase (beta-lactamase superfamily II)
MAWRRRRVIIGLWVGLLGLLLALTAFVRIQRHQFDPPEPLRASILRVHGAVADFYVARNGERVLLFDTGADPEGRGLDAALATLHASREDVSDIFVTHGHGDHIAAVTLCPRARVHAGAADAPMIAKRGSFAPSSARIFSYLMPVPPAAVTDSLTAAGEIPVGEGEPVRVLPFPGHTPGSVAYVWRGVLFVGDSMNYEKDRLTAAFAPFTVDTGENRRRIAGLPAVLPLDEIHVVCTGHAGCTREAETRRLLDELIAKVKS